MASFVPPPPAGSPSNAQEEEDDFSNIYGAYRGPRTRHDSPPNPSQQRSIQPKQTEEDEDSDDCYALQKDFNGLPLEFTSTEDKAFRAKQRQKEKAMKQQQEDADICGICGQKGHFTQGCPNTLGGGSGRAAGGRFGGGGGRGGGGGGGRPGRVVETMSLPDSNLKRHLIGAKGATVKGIESGSECKIQFSDLPAGKGFNVAIHGPSRAACAKAKDLIEEVIENVTDTRSAGRGRGGGGGGGGDQYQGTGTGGGGMTAAALMQMRALQGGGGAAAGGGRGGAGGLVPLEQVGELAATLQRRQMEMELQRRQIEMQQEMQQRMMHMQQQMQQQQQQMEGGMMKRKQDQEAAQTVYTKALRVNGDELERGYGASSGYGDERDASGRGRYDVDMTGLCEKTRANILTVLDWQRTEEEQEIQRHQERMKDLKKQADEHVAYHKQCDSAYAQGWDGSSQYGEESTKAWEGNTQYGDQSQNIQQYGDQSQYAQQYNESQNNDAQQYEYSSVYNAQSQGATLGQMGGYVQAYSDMQSNVVYGDTEYSSSVDYP